MENRSFQSVIDDPDVQEAHYQAKREYLPHMSEHGVVQADLVFFESYKHQNNGYIGLLTVINVPSRYGFAVPIKTKKEAEITHAFEIFLKEAKAHNQDVVRLETDNGSEFLNRSFNALLKKNNIEHTTGAPGDHRFSAVCERFNQSLRNWIDRYLTVQKTNRWIDILDQIIDHYNNRKHRTLGVSPASMTKEDEDELRHQQYDATQAVRDQVNSIRPGDRVRILIHKTAYAKGRLRWSDNVYTIKERVPNSYSFRIEETPTIYKYSDIQLVRNEAQNIGKKTARTDQLAKERAHAQRFARSGLARGADEAHQAIQAVHANEPPAQEGPRRVPERVRTVPARLRVDLGEVRAVPARAEARVERATTFTAEDRDVGPRRSGRVRTAPAWMRDYETRDK